MAVVTVNLTSAPALVPPKGTLLDAATVTDDAGDIFWSAIRETGVIDGLYESSGCLDVGARTPALCGTPVNPTASIPSSWVDGVAFGGYGLLRCRAVGFDWATAETKVRDAYLAGESRAIERGFMDLHLATPGSTDLTPGAGAVSVPDGLAILEGYLGRYYAGQGVIHAPRALGSLLTTHGGVSLEGNRLVTGLGTKVAAGGGYYVSKSPAGVAAPAGEGWMYATGEVLIKRAPLETWRSFTPADNDINAYAQRMYVIAADCISVGVRVAAVFS